MAQYKRPNLDPEQAEIKGQLAALGERLLVLEKEEDKSFIQWFLTLGDVPEEDKEGQGE